MTCRARLLVGTFNLPMLLACYGYPTGTFNSTVLMTRTDFPAGPTNTQVLVAGRNSQFKASAMLNHY